MKRNQLLIAYLFVSISAGYGQAPSPSQAPAFPSGAVNAPKPVAFHSDLLDVTFTYPASMVAQTLPSLKEQHDAMAAKHPADATAEERKMDACSDQALLALRAYDPNHLPAPATNDGARPGAAPGTARHAITGKVLISRIGVECMPASYRNQLDNVAAAMSAALAQDRDLHPIDQPIWYEINQTRVHFAAADSGSAKSTAGAAKTAQPRWVGSAAIVWNENLISIVIESNDLAFFNDMLHSKLALGTATAVPLFPAEIGGEGKPLEIKP